MVGTQAIGCNAVYHGEDATYSHAEAHRLPCLSPNPSINMCAPQEQMLQIKVQSEELFFLGSIDVVSILCCRMSGRIFLIPVIPKLGERWPTKSHVFGNMYTKPVYGMCRPHDGAFWASFTASVACSAYVSSLCQSFLFNPTSNSHLALIILP